ncbi:MAG TPA: hypothetical protein VK705_07025 [Ferruginibacter sp.]|nr:hypothetical protein [Ferruginibacter sp.]
MTILTEIRAIIGREKIKQKDLCPLWGVDSRQQVGNILAGKSPLTDARIEAILKKYGYDFNFKKIK